MDWVETRCYRILDANLDRAREGLRILEEWCRFGLERADLSATCKALRQEVGRWHRPEFRQARDTPHDPGTRLSHPQERQRADLNAVLLANCARVQEALRVIEEYGKLIEGDLSDRAKAMRYQIYVLESQLQNRDRLSRLQQARLYLVTSPHPRLLEVVEAALSAGLQLVQYRDKNQEDATRLETACRLAELCQRYGALFLVNDRVDLALASGADGVHLGQQDVPMEVARRILGPDRIVGRSTTNPEELARANAEGADYIGVGPIFATPTKPGKAAAGFDYLAYARQQAQQPFYAIGGIDASNAAEVIAAGADRLAVVRAIMDAPDPKAATAELLQML